MAVFRAIPPPAPPPPGGAGTTGSSPKASALADKVAIVRRSAARQGRSLRRFAAPSYGKHPLTEEANPPVRARAFGEPPLHVDDQDVLPQSGVAGGERRHGGCGHHPPRAGEHDR